MQTMMKVIGLVRLSQDIEVRFTQAGSKWATGSVVHNEPSSDPAKSQAHFFRIKAFGETAKFLEGKRKGTPLMIEGNLRVEKWKTKEGQERETVVAVISYVRYIRSKAEEDALNKPAPASFNEGGWGNEGGSAGDGFANAWDTPAASTQADASDNFSDVPF